MLPIKPQLMFLNNLKLAFRSILRKKGYSLTSIIGMAVGITCCLVITLFVLDELSYDQYHEKKDRIYRLVTTSGHSGNSHAKIAGRWGLAAKGSRDVRRRRIAAGCRAAGPRRS